MKTILGLLIAGVAFAQTPQHSVTVAWQDTQNPQGSTTYTVYRAAGLCSGTPTWSKVATSLSVMTYKDTAVTPGNYCYEVTATVAGMESAPSNTALATVPSFPPQQLTVTTQ